MTGLHQAEQGWIATFQGTGAHQQVMLWFSYLGAEVLPVALAFVYFASSRNAGARLYLLYSLGGWLLQVSKLAFHLPRPYWVDPRIKALGGSGGYGLPSGHVLSASIVWPCVARALVARWACVIAILFVLFVSVSRVYLGVHFISDVLVAWMIAVGLFWGVDRSERKLSNWLNALSPLCQMLAAFWATALLVVIGFGVSVALEGVTDPPAWSKYSAGARNLSGLIRAGGEFFGAACGIILAGRWASFEVNGPFWKRGVACGYALLGAWLIRELSRMIPSPDMESLRSYFNFLYGAVSNFWMLFVAPWILLRMGLLSRSAASVVEVSQQETAMSPR